jgi:hypothetical protein
MNRLTRSRSAGILSRVNQRRQGFTLVEIAISSALSVALIVIVLAWVRNVAAVTGTAPEHQATRRVAAVVEAQFISDTERAGACDEQRLGSAVHSVSPTHVSFWADVDGDRRRDLVRWEVLDGALVRSIESGAGGCSTSGAPAVRVQARGVREGGAGKFVPVAGGSDVMVNSSVSCSAVPDPCRYGAIRFRVVLDEGAGPVVVLHTARLSR